MILLLNAACGKRRHSIIGYGLYNQVLRYLTERLGDLSFGILNLNDILVRSLGESLLVNSSKLLEPKLV